MPVANGIKTRASETFGYPGGRGFPIRSAGLPFANAEEQAGGQELFRQPQRTVSRGHLDDLLTRMKKRSDKGQLDDQLSLPFFDSRVVDVAGSGEQYLGIDGNTENSLTDDRCAVLVENAKRNPDVIP